MNIDHPSKELYPAMEKLWQDTFGDPKEVTERFFATAFLEDHTLCAVKDHLLQGVVYWIDCTRGEEKWAYIYAFAVDQGSRGQGIGKKLMEKAFEILESRDYTGVLLLPGEDWLWDYYGKMGFAPFGSCREVSCEPKEPASLCKLTPEEYLEARNALLPAGSICHTLPMYEYLAGWLEYCRGEELVCAVGKEGVEEFLGDPARLPGVLAATGTKTAKIPGLGKPCGMYRAFEKAEEPACFGLPGM